MEKLIIIEPSFLIRRALYVTLKENFNVDIVLSEESLESLREFMQRKEPVGYTIISETLLNSNQYKQLDAQYLGKQIIITRGVEKEIVKANYCRINIDSTGDQLIKALQSAIKPNNDSRKESLSDLSERERDVLKLVAKGFINKEIADSLFISTHTVITHRKNITAKLGIKTVSGLTVYAILNGLIPIETPL